MSDFPESDWKKFRTLHKVALDRFCTGVLDEAAGITADRQPSNHEAYRRLYRLMRERDKELARLFDDFRRSTALRQLLAIYSEGLVTEEELATFSAETQHRVRALRDIL